MHAVQINAQGFENVKKIPPMSVLISTRIFHACDVNVKWGWFALKFIGSCEDKTNRDTLFPHWGHISQSVHMSKASSLLQNVYLESQVLFMLKYFQWIINLIWIFGDPLLYRLVDGSKRDSLIF